MFGTNGANSAGRRRTHVPPLLVERDVSAAAVSAAAEDCAESKQPGIATSATAIAERLSQRDSLVAIKPTPSRSAVPTELKRPGIGDCSSP